MNLNFAQVRPELENQFTHTRWLPGSGLDRDALEAQIKQLEAADLPRAICKAKTLELIAAHGQIAIDKADIFQDKLIGRGLMAEQRIRWEQEIYRQHMPEQPKKKEDAWLTYGSYIAGSDFGHTSPNSMLLLQIGFPGLLARIREAAGREHLTEKQKTFYTSCEISLNAAITLATRLATAIRPYNEENAQALLQLTVGAPRNTYEALQLIVLYFFLHEYIAGTRVRTLGRLDAMFYPFYRQDLEAGTFTHAQIKQMLKFFLHKLWISKVPYDLPFCLGGIDRNGNEVTNEMSRLIVETYNELNIYSPKIHIRVSEKTPPDFVKQVLACIRGGNSSFVFVHDRIGMQSLTKVGIEEEDARDYVPIGCYEPAVWGMEIGCTGNGGVSLPKALEYVITRGRDLRTGDFCGIDTGEIDSPEKLMTAIKQQIAFIANQVCGFVTEIEKYYGQIGPDPLLSCQYDQSVETGVDVFEGGAKYNNSSLYFYSIATLVDSICAINRLVFREKRLTFAELCRILRSNWEGQALLRAQVLNFPEKYGNGNPEADAIAVEIADYCASITNTRPNSRGGIFKAALFSIDYGFQLGQLTMATPDGRLAGDPLSKNLCATVGMDKKGITTLISSVTKMDLSRFPTGSVLDILLHPSAVKGQAGLDAFYAILMTYFEKGGFAMHGNVFSTEDLKAAQKHPEKYQTLQVRVCGWNAYFVTLSKAEQDAFIRQAEMNETDA